MILPLFQDIARQKKAFLRLLASAMLLLICYEIGSFFVAEVLNMGLKRYYCLNIPADILCIGHSMSEMGIDKKILEKKLGCSVAKYCINGVGPTERKIILQHYLESSSKVPRILVYDVSGRIFSSGLSYNSYQLFLPFITKSRACRSLIDSACSYREKLFYLWNPLQRYESSRIGAAWRGFTGDWQSRKRTNFNPVDFQKKISEGNFWKISLNPQDVSAFQETVEICRKNNILLVLAALPCVDILNQAESEKYAEVMKILESYVAQNKHVYLLDLNPEFSHKYELFADPIHLRPEGQKVISDALAVKLRDLIN